jgi:hypothetical protein
MSLFIRRTLVTSTRHLAGKELIVLDSGMHAQTHVMLVFTVNGVDLEEVELFKYLGRPLSSLDSDWPAVQYYNLKRRRASIGHGFPES